MIQLTLLLTAAFILFGYEAIITKKYGILPSFSDSYYITGQKPYFTLMLLTVSFLLMGVTKDYPFMLAGSILIGFTAVAAPFKEKLARQVHYLGAFGGFTLFVVGFIVDLNMYIPPILSVLGIAPILIFNVPKRLFWVELILCVIILGGLLWTMF